MPKKFAGSSRLRNTGQMMRSFTSGPLSWKAFEVGYRSQLKQQEKAERYMRKELKSIDLGSEFKNVTEAERRTLVKYGFIPHAMPAWEQAEPIIKNIYQQMMSGEIGTGKASREITRQLNALTAGDVADIAMAVRQGASESETATTYLGQKVSYKGLKETSSGWRMADQRSKIKMYYSAGSKVMASIDGMTAVKLSNRMQGWITPEGRFVAKDEIRQHLYSVSKTMYGRAEGITLLDIYDSMSPVEQARVSKALMNMDWSQFYDEYINSPVEQGAYVEELTGKAGYEMLLDIMIDARE